MSINDYRTDGVLSGEAEILMDFPGFGLTKSEGQLRYTWAPEVCSAEIFDGFLEVMGLQADEEWFSGGVFRGTLIEREEALFATED